jgi:hypothetical protein
MIAKTANRNRFIAAWTSYKGVIRSCVALEATRRAIAAMVSGKGGKLATGRFVTEPTVDRRGNNS